MSLGCDNYSCGDCQNIFSATKLLCLSAAASEPDPAGVHAANAFRAATVGTDILICPTIACVA